MLILLTLVGAAFLVREGLNAVGTGLPFYVAAAAFLLVGPITYMLGDVVRRAIMPAFVVAGGFWQLVGTRLFWAFGPQTWAMLAGWFVLSLVAAGFSGPSHPSASAVPSVQHSSDMPHAEAAAEKSNPPPTSLTDSAQPQAAEVRDLPPHGLTTQFDDYKADLDRAGFTVSGQPLNCENNELQTCSYDVERIADHRKAVLTTYGPLHRIDAVRWVDSN
jgi:hypothetical protein